MEGYGYENLTLGEALVKNGYEDVHGSSPSMMLAECDVSRGLGKNTSMGSRFVGGKSKEHFIASNGEGAVLWVDDAAGLPSKCSFVNAIKGEEW